RYAERGEPILGHVDMRLLLESIGDAWHVVIHEAAADPERGFVVQNIVDDGQRATGFAREAGSARKSTARSTAVGADFVHVDYELDFVTVHDVPSVSAQLVLELIDEMRASEQDDPGLASEHDTQPMIEAGKVVHVRVRDENMRDAHQLPRRQHAQITQIKEQRAAFIAEVDIEAGVTERLVDKAR